MGKQDGGKTVAHIYAQAIFGVALELGTVAETQQEIVALRDVLRQDRRVRLFLDSPTVSFASKRKVLAAALEGCGQPTLNLLLLLVRNQRVEIFEQIAGLYHDLANARAGVAEFSVQTARPLEAAEAEKLKNVLRKKLQREVVLLEKSNPDLLGGLVLSHRDFRWDASLIHQLGRLVDKMESHKGELKVLHED